MRAVCDVHISRFYFMYLFQTSVSYIAHFHGIIRIAFALHR